MDAVTYPAGEVQAELKNWTMIRVNIADQREVAEQFGVEAIPDAIAVMPDGRMVDSILGFVEPAEFETRLKNIREKSGKQ